MCPSERHIISSIDHPENCLSSLPPGWPRPPHLSAPPISPQPCHSANYHLSPDSPVASEFLTFPCSCSCSFALSSPPPAVPLGASSGSSVPPCPSTTFPKDSADSSACSPLFYVLLDSPPASFPLFVSWHTVPSAQYPSSARSDCSEVVGHACDHRPQLPARHPAAGISESQQPRALLASRSS